MIGGMGEKQWMLLISDVENVGVMSQLTLGLLPALVIAELITIGMVPCLLQDRNGERKQENLLQT